MKLFTIGDSISQGFMSAAAARTDQCYSTILANIFLAFLPGIYRAATEECAENLSKHSYPYVF